MEPFLCEPTTNKDIVITKSDEGHEKGSWKPLFRQILICSGAWNTYFMAGIALGAPTVIIAQLRKEANSTEAVNEEMASWISSIHGLASVPWFILSLVSAWIGRKYTSLGVTIFSLVSFIILYFSNTPKQILIAEIFQSPIFASMITVSLIYATECTSAKYRGVFLSLQAASFNWGMWLANALGIFLHWKSIAIAGIICSVYNLLTAFYCCESPSWLAAKHRYEECARVHRWIKGDEEESQNELQALIQSCKNDKVKQDREKRKHSLLSRSFRIILEKGFYLPFLMNISIVMLIHSSGKIVCSVYAIEVMSKITSTQSSAIIGLMVLHGVAVIGMYMGCILSKYLKRRTLFLVGSSGGISFLFLLAIYLYLIKFTIVNENNYISVSILSLYYIFINFGPMTMSAAISGELYPLKYRAIGIFTSGIISQSLQMVTLKTAPEMFRTFELHGSFLFYVIISFIIILVLYKYLPETKDKTMQEIEEYFVGKLRKQESIEAHPILTK